jgi:hypothetical protein
MPQMGVTPPLGGISMGPRSIIFGTPTDPNAAAADSKANDLARAGIGSLYLSRSDGSLWSKTAAADGINLTGVWTARS